MRIYKFIVDDPYMPLLPNGLVLHIGLDIPSGNLAIWMVCDPNDSEPRHTAPYVAVMTGEDIPNYAGRYLTTVVGVQGRMVVHFFKTVEGNKKSFNEFAVNFLEV